MPPERIRSGASPKAAGEWNSRYRDDVRRFWRGGEGMLGLFASRICGSAGIYTKSGKGRRGFRPGTSPPSAHRSAR